MILLHQQQHHLRSKRHMLVLRLSRFAVQAGLFAVSLPFCSSKLLCPITERFVCKAGCYIQHSQWVCDYRTTQRITPRETLFSQCEQYQPNSGAEKQRERKHRMFVDKQTQAEQMIVKVSVIWGGAGDRHAHS
jgi:hypothetical protein